MLHVFDKDMTIIQKFFSTLHCITIVFLHHSRNLPLLFWSHAVPERRQQWVWVDVNNFLFKFEMLARLKRVSYLITPLCEWYTYPGVQITYLKQRLPDMWLAIKLANCVCARMKHVPLTYDAFHSATHIAQNFKTISL